MPPLELDHIIYAAPTLEAGMDAIEHQLGMRPIYGGQHHGRGTHNALLGLGEACYLEVIAPDPAQPDVPRPLWMGVDQVTAPGLIGWAVRTPDLSAFRDAALAEDWPVGSIAAGERRTARGDMLRWRLTEPSTDLADGLFPFAIDWEATPQPGAQLPQVGTVEQLEVQMGQPSQLSAVSPWLPMLKVTPGPRRVMLQVRDVEGTVRRL